MIATPASATTDKTAFDHVMQLASGFAVSSAFYTATKLGIPDLLAHGAVAVANSETERDQGS